MHILDSVDRYRTGLISLGSLTFGSRQKGIINMLPPFANEPFTDFADERNAAVMREAIANVESQFGREYPVIIGGRSNRPRPQGKRRACG